MDTIPSQTILSFTDNGTVYEVDHRGLEYDLWWGLFAVYRDGHMLTEFAVPELRQDPVARLDLPGDERITELAKQAIAAARKRSRA